MNAIIFGASGGIGGALCQAVIASGHYATVFAVSRTPVTIPGAVPLVYPQFDDESLADIAQRVSDQGPLALCLSALGTLSDASEDRTPERTLRSQTVAAFESVFHTNTILPALIAKHMVPLMPRKERAVFAALSARVGSISDNRLGGWHAYRASKAALNMLIKNYAIEQARRAPEFIAVGLHPGTVDTALSSPFQKGVPEGKLFSPAQSAGYLLSVIHQLTPDDTGKVFDWQGTEVPA
ncbi:SDR family NAD(P)-dependent oxidoreductase [Alphaproteobacteria bacterium]|nr:SDR family NAD(P)-dependent oxidoreductase [Alphaproteobacteria bacterium]